MKNERITYRYGNTELHGELFYQETTEKRPCILVAHAWMGQDDFARNKAMSLAALGYVAFALDYYGTVAHSKEEAQSLMQPLHADRNELLGRLKAGYDAVKGHPKVDATRMGAIGFCFGGLSVIELFRSAVPLKGVVSFHAVLGASTPLAKNIKGSILILHGYNDPLVSQEAVLECQREFNDAHIDWQMHLYGNTSHAFTVAQANDPEMGLKYNPLAEKRSWQSMKNLFDEVFA
ncbi:MAG: dienelactone hydrolase family protein [Verrucomicrobia bacterium]|nr:dienelactone hydrolase family protein [Verrucomicrobiota bacterium]